MKKDIKIFDIAKRDNWAVEYDSDLDTFYWTKPKISSKTVSRKFLDDFSLYVTDKGEIEGLFIEYAKFNFLSHNEEYKPIIDQMVKVDDTQYALTPDKVKGVESLLENMANKVANETLDAVLHRGIELKGVAFAS
jgi:hypothetical protein